MAGEDKQMFKQFCQEGLPHVLEALSPPQSSGISPNKYIWSNLDECVVCVGVYTEGAKNGMEKNCIKITVIQLNFEK